MAVDQPVTEATQAPRRNRYSVRTDSGPIALRAFWSMHVEALNGSGMGHAEYAERSVFRRMRCAFGVVGWKNPATKSTDDPASSECPSQLSSAANCARRKYG
jgi:hypothetical protein